VWVAVGFQRLSLRTDNCERGRPTREHPNERTPPKERGFLGGRGVFGAGLAETLQ